MHVGESAEKKDVLERLLELGMVLVALDARADGVDVPDHLGRDPQLRLNLSYRFGLPMAVDPWGIDATLTFGGVPYACRFPWGAIYLLVSHVNGEPYLFPDEVPPELLAQVGVEGAWSLPNEKRRPAPSSRPKLSLVVSPEGPEDDRRRDNGADGASTPGAPSKGQANAGTPADAEAGPPPTRAVPRRGSRATARRTPEPKPAAPQQVDGPNAEEGAPRGGDAPPPKVQPAHATPPGPRPAADAPVPDPGDDAPTASGPSRRRGHLRLVK